MESSMNLETKEVEELKVMSFWQKLTGIFFSPLKVMENIVEYPKMLWPIVFSSIITILAMIVRMPLLEITNEKMEYIFLERYGIDYGALQGGVSAETTGIITAVSAPVGVLIAWAIGAIVLWLFVKIFRGKASLRQILSLTAHVLMVTSIGAVLGSAVGLLLHTDILVFSLAVLFPQGDMASFGFNVMQMMEVFSIWGAVLTAIGLSVLCQWSKTKSYIVSFLLFILGVLFSAASTTSVFWMYDMMSKNGLF